MKKKTEFGGDKLLDDITYDLIEKFSRTNIPVCIANNIIQIFKIGYLIGKSRNKPPYDLETMWDNNKNRKSLKGRFK
jgi:hypothetical protein